MDYSIDIQFQEEYKRLDALCRDCLSNEKGVTEYIRQMELIPWSAYRNVPSWENDLKMLKHIRWVRNELAHEIGTLGSELCQESDLQFTIDFHDKILSRTDPLTALREFQSQQSPSRTANRNIPPKPTQSYAPPAAEYEPARPSLWKRFLLAFKKRFKH